ncbi:MAG: hypothetical protein ACLFPQ_01260 [Candidatus Woesearchaeota archaeon]
MFFLKNFMLLLTRFINSLKTLYQNVCWTINWWLYARGINDVYEQRSFIEKSCMNSLEFCISWDEERIQSMLNSSTEDKYSHISLHLPQFLEPQQIAHLDYFKTMKNLHNISAFVLHRNHYKQDYLDLLVGGLGADLVIENLDGTFDNSKKIKHLIYLKENTPCGFILDVQHAYENDPSMNYGHELFDLIKDRLSHLHVSGETDDLNHALLYKAKNKDRLSSFLYDILSLKNVPMIVEGKYVSFEELKEETRFIESIFREKLF